MRIFRITSKEQVLILSFSSLQEVNGKSKILFSEKSTSSLHKGGRISNYLYLMHTLILLFNSLYQ